MSVPQKSSTENELKFYNRSVKVLSSLIIIYFIISFLMGGVLSSNHPNLVSGILGGFIGIGLFIQIRRYLLFRRLGKGSEFLMSRSLVFIVIVILLIIYFLFL